MIELCLNNYETINNYDNTTNNYENIINNNILPNYVIPSGDGNTYITTENTNPNVVINNGTTKSDTAQQSQQSKQESVNNQKVISKVETPNTGDVVPVVEVVRLGDHPRAGGGALADLVVHAGAAGLVRVDLPGAGADGEHHAHHVQHLPHHRGALEGPEVLRPVLLLLAHQLHPGVALL